MTGCPPPAVRADRKRRTHLAASTLQKLPALRSAVRAPAPFDLEQFRMGMDVELEHGARDPQTNVTDDDLTMTAKIARAHLDEFPDYYTRLAKMEAEAEANRTAQGE
jgi:hypothetical protein